MQQEHLFDKVNRLILTLSRIFRFASFMQRPISQKRSIRKSVLSRLINKDTNIYIYLINAMAK